jgi:CheY-like chemotaxis protein
MGIEAKSLGAIFDMFTTTGRDVRGLREGLGIGLSLAKRLIEMQSGSLTAHSDGPGKGSRFVISLPLVTPAAPAAERLPGERPADGAITAVPRRVLLVDDNVDAVSTLSTLLEWNRHEALPLVAEFQPEIVILDIGMAGMNGYEVAKAIRAMPGGGSYVLVALTGWGSVSDRERARAAGFDEHLTKPVDVARIEAILARSSPPRPDRWPR